MQWLRGQKQHKKTKKSKDECESKLKFYIVMSNTIFYIL